MITIKSAATVTICLLLSACGGGGSSSEFSIDAFEDEFSASVGETVANYRGKIADPASLPGTASFSGLVLLPTNIDATEALAGRMRLDADFETESLTGAADSFGIYDLDFSSATAFAGALEKRHDLSGILSVSDATTAPFTPSGGQTFQVIEGALSGTLNGASLSYEIDTRFFGGVLESETSDALVANADIVGSVVSQNGAIEYGDTSGINGALILFAD